MFDCETVSLPMGANCTLNNDSTYNYKCQSNEDSVCFNPTLWAI